MDRSRENREAAGEFSPLRAGITAVAVIGIVATCSWIVRTYPNAGYEAGYEATATHDRDLIRNAVDGAGGTSGAFCDVVHHEAERTPLEPRYDYDTFIKGCAAAINHLYGRDVPMGRP